MTVRYTPVFVLHYQSVIWIKGLPHISRFYCITKVSVEWSRREMYSSSDSDVANTLVCRTGVLALDFAQWKNLFFFFLKNYHCYNWTLLKLGSRIRVMGKWRRPTWCWSRHSRTDDWSINKYGYWSHPSNTTPRRGSATCRDGREHTASQYQDNIYV